MTKKFKKLVLLAAVGGVLLLVCGGVSTVVAVSFGPALWGWAKTQTAGLVELHPEARQFVAGLATQLDPGLRDALTQMGQVTLEPAQLLEQLKAAAIPASVLAALSPAEMNALFESWGVPVRVALPAAAAVGVGAAAGAAVDGAEGGASGEEAETGEGDEP